MNAVARWLCLAAFVVACSDQKKSVPGAGTVGGPCYPNSTCNAGLTCYSNLCVDTGVRDGGGGASSTGGATGLGGSTSGGATGNPDASGTGGVLTDSGIDAQSNGDGASSGGNSSNGGSSSTGGSSGTGGTTGGGTGSGGMGPDSSAPNGHGHIVLIGHGFDNNDSTDQRILENAVFLTERSGTVRVLEYTEFNSGTSATVEPFLTSYAGSVGRAISFAALTDYRNLQTALPNADVLLIYDQPNDPYRGPQVSFIANTWSPDMEAFMAAGGVVVVLDGGSSSTAAFAGGPSGFYLAAGSSPVTTTLAVEDSTDPVAAGVTSPFTSTTGFTKYPRASNGNIVVGTSDNLDPVVLHNAVPAHLGGTGGGSGTGGTTGTGGVGGSTADGAGPHGHVVLIGHDFMYNDTADQRILENAIFLSEHPGNLNVLEYTEGLSNGFSSEPVDAYVHGFVSPYATSIGRGVTFTPLTDYRKLRDYLPNADVLLVYDQFLASFLNLRFISYDWSPQLGAFLDRGGVLIVSDNPSNETFNFAYGLNFASTSRTAVTTTLTVSVATDPIASGIPSPFSSTTQYTQYAGLTGGIAVVASTGSLAPVVVHLTL